MIMIKLFKHVSEYHRTTETLTINECGQGVYIGVHSIRELPFGESEEQITSIVVPLSEIPELIGSLTKLMESE